MGFGSRAIVSVQVGYEDNGVFIERIDLFSTFPLGIIHRLTWQVPAVGYKAVNEGDVYGDGVRQYVGSLEKPLALGTTSRRSETSFGTGSVAIVAKIGETDGPRFAGLEFGIEIWNGCGWQPADGNGSASDPVFEHAR